MLFGEYIVLCGSKSLAIPLKFEQTLKVEEDVNTKWESYCNGEQWFEMKLGEDFEVLSATNENITSRLVKIFRTIGSNNSDISFKNKFSTEANFDLDWGIGSSSTLISLLSQWSQVDWRLLLEKSFGGSGYDVACATSQGPLLFSMSGCSEQVNLAKNITDHILFVYSGKKQSSEIEVSNFDKEKIGEHTIERMDEIIRSAIQSETIEQFEQSINESEEMLSLILGKSKISDEQFMDYPYSTKSLGAWGGDFILATYRNEVEARQYFSNKGLKTHFTYNEIIKR